MKAWLLAFVFLFSMQSFATENECEPSLNPDVPAKAKLPVADVQGHAPSTPENRMFMLGLKTLQERGIVIEPHSREGAIAVNSKFIEEKLKPWLIKNGLESKIIIATPKPPYKPHSLLAIGAILLEVSNPEQTIFDQMKNEIPEIYSIREEPRNPPKPIFFASNQAVAESGWSVILKTESEKEAPADWMERIEKFPGVSSAKRRNALQLVSIKCSDEVATQIQSQFPYVVMERDQIRGIF